MAVAAVMKAVSDQNAVRLLLRVQPGELQESPENIGAMHNSAQRFVHKVNSKRN